MKSFATYLTQNGYVEKSIQRAEYYASDYLNWLSERNLDITEVRYSDLMNYVGYLQQTGSSKTKVNEALRNLRLYYDYLKIPNIAYGVVVRGEPKESLPLLTAEELDKLYHHFETQSQKGYWRHSDKILLGLIVYQCLDTRDILRLELEHLNLQTGKLNVPSGSRRKESRTMTLEAHQILQLHQYIENHRDKTTEKLFSPQCSCLGRLQGQLKALFKQVKPQGDEIGLKIIRFSQIRQSRITLWIKQYGLRKTQYLAGFKRVENVERYRQQDNEDLQEAIKNYHPLK